PASWWPSCGLCGGAGPVVGSVAAEKQTARQWSAAGRHHGDLVPSPQLASARPVLQLEDGLVQEPEPVQPSTGQLPALGVQRQPAVMGDGAALVEEGTHLAALAEAEGLQPHQGQEAEAVVEFGEVDVGGGEVG